MNKHKTTHEREQTTNKIQHTLLSIALW